MRISFDNNFLFTAGRDGTLIIHDIKDRDPRGGVIKRDFGGVLNFSEEILTEKQEMEEFETVREQLETQLQAFKDPASSGVDNKMGSNELDSIIQSLNEDRSERAITARNQYDQLLNKKQDLEESYEKQLKLLLEQQHEELEARKTEYNEKMLSDAALYTDLQKQQMTDRAAFENAQQKIQEEHTSTCNINMKNHNDFVDKQKLLIQKLKQEIQKMKEDNTEMMQQIHEDANTEHEEIEKKNASNLA